MSVFEQRLAILQQDARYQLLRGIRRGIEKKVCASHQKDSWRRLRIHPHWVLH